MYRCLTCLGYVLLTISSGGSLLLGGPSTVQNAWGKLPLSFEATSDASPTRRYMARGQSYAISVSGAAVTIGVRSAKNAYSLLSARSGAYNSLPTAGMNSGSQAFDNVLHGDFNDDSKSDYSRVTDILEVGIGDGVGHFTFAPAMTITPAHNFLARGDFNLDGRTDLLLYRQSDGAVAAGLSRGDGTFTFLPQNFSPGFTSAVVGDYNGDVVSDVILYNNQTPPYNAYLLPREGTGQFAPSTGLFFGSGFVVYPADLNVDGTTDFISYRPADGTVFVAISGGESFTYRYVVYSPRFSAFQIDDVNGDGFPDLVLYDATNAYGHLLLGDGSGNFTSSASLFFGPGMDGVDLRDFNGDGKQDVLLYGTADGTSFTGLISSSGLDFSYTYDNFGPGGIVAQYL